MGYLEAWDRIDASTAQIISDTAELKKKKKKQQPQPTPKAVTEKLKIMKGIGVEGPKPKTALERLIDKPLPTSTSDVRVIDVGKPNIPTRVTQTRLQDQFVPKTPSQQPRLLPM